MKSVTIKNERGEVILKIIHRKNGMIDMVKIEGISNLDIEVRDDQNSKVWFK